MICKYVNIIENSVERKTDSNIAIRQIQCLYERVYYFYAIASTVGLDWETLRDLSNVIRSLNEGLNSC